MATQPIAPPTSAATRILDRSMCLAIARSWPPITKTVPTDSPIISTQANRRFLHFQKDIINSPALRKLFSAHNKLDSWLDTRALPFPLKNGIYLLPTDLYNETEGKLADFTGNILPPLLTAVEADYAASIERARQELADMFNEADYLPPAGFMARITFSWSYLQFGVSEALRQISREAFAREQEKLEMQMKEGSAEIRKILRLQWQEMVNHMVDRLTDEDGKKKVFRNSMLDKINDAISVFNPRNLSEDSDLALLVNQAQQMLNGVSPEQLRSDEAIRRNLQQGFSQMKQQLDGLVEQEAERQIRFS